MQFQCAVYCHNVNIMLPGAWSWMCDFFLGMTAGRWPEGLNRQCPGREFVPMCGTLVDIWLIQGGCLSKSCIFQADVSSCEQIWGSLCGMSCLWSCVQRMTLWMATMRCDVHSVSPCREGTVRCQPHRVYRQGVGLDMFCSESRDLVSVMSRLHTQQMHVRSPQYGRCGLVTYVTPWLMLCMHAIFRLEWAYMCSSFWGAAEPLSKIRSSFQQLWKIRCILVLYSVLISGKLCL